MNKEQKPIVIYSTPNLEDIAGVCSVESEIGDDETGITAAASNILQKSDEESKSNEQFHFLFKGALCYTNDAKDSLKIQKKLVEA